MVPGMGTGFFFPDNGSLRLVKVDFETEPGAIGETVLAYLLLVGGPADAFEMAIFAMVVAVITQLPVGVEIHIIGQTAEETDL